jgi:hypothetical protein
LTYRLYFLLYYALAVVSVTAKESKSEKNLGTFSTVNDFNSISGKIVQTNNNDVVNKKISSLNTACSKETWSLTNNTVELTGSKDVSSLVKSFEETELTKPKKYDHLIFVCNEEFAHIPIPVTRNKLTYEFPSEIGADVVLNKGELKITINKEPRNCNKINWYYSSKKMLEDSVVENEIRKISVDRTVTYEKNKKYIIFVCDEEEFEVLDLGAIKFNEYTFTSNKKTKVNVNLIKGELHIKNNIDPAECNKNKWYYTENVDNLLGKEAELTQIDEYSFKLTYVPSKYLVHECVENQKEPIPLELSMEYSFQKKIGYSQFSPTIKLKENNVITITPNRIPLNCNINKWYLTNYNDLSKTKLDEVLDKTTHRSRKPCGIYRYPMKHFNITTLRFIATQQCMHTILSILMKQI